MNVSRKQLGEMIPSTERLLDKFYEPLQETLERYAINNTRRIAAFIAQITHETESLHYMEEIDSGMVYTGRRDLGNDLPEAIVIAKAHGKETGPFFKGRGGIQTTGYLNYKKVAEALNIDCVNTPQLLTDPRYAMLSSGIFWVTHGRRVEGESLNCNELADLDFFTLICRVVNGGTRGLQRRLNYYRNNIRILHE